MRCEQKLLSNMSFVPFGDLLLEPLRNGLTKPKAVRGDGVKMIGMGEIFANSRIGSISMSRVPVTEKELSNNCIKKGDILFARQSLALEGAGRCSIVIDVTEETVFESHLIRARIDSSKANPYFVYYYFNSYVGKEHIKTIVEQVAAAGIRGSDLVRLKVPCPDLETQNRIAAILSALDEKIATNREINDNLLEQALTLYSTQFSTIERNGCIGDYCSIKSGFAFKSSWWTHSGVKVIKIGSINQDNLNLLECSYVDNDKIEKAKDFKVGAGDLLIAMTGATIGKFAMVPYSSEILLVNQRVGKFFLGDNPVKKLPFIYCTLKQPEVYSEVVNRGQGSAQPNISASDIMSIPCVIPSQGAINSFNDTTQPLFDLIISNQRENQQLSKLRDTLLSKLMSGEINII